MAEISGGELLLKCLQKEGVTRISRFLKISENSRFRL